MIDVRSIRELLGELLHAAAVKVQPGPVEVPTVHRFANGVTCWCGAEHWRTTLIDPRLGSS